MMQDHIVVKDLVKSLIGEVPTEIAKRKKFVYLKYYYFDKIKIINMVREALSQLDDVWVDVTTGSHNVKSMVIRVYHSGGQR